MSPNPTDAAPDDPEPLDANTLMRRLFDLWQEQWGAVAADPTMAEEWARAMATLSMMGNAPGVGWPTSTAQPFAGFQNTPLGAMMAASSAVTPTPSANGFPAAPPGAPPPAPASDDRADRLDELLARLDRLERRLDALGRSGPEDVDPGPDAGAGQGAERGEPSQPEHPRSRRRS